MKFLNKNDAVSTVAVDFDAASTEIILATGTGADFPLPDLSETYFVGTLSDAATRQVKEIVWVIQRSGDVLTVIRGQENTIALNWDAGAFFENLWTAGQAQSVVQVDEVPPSISLEVDLVEIDAIDINDPPASVDGQDLVSGNTLLLTGMLDPVFNGGWRFNGLDVPLSRMTQMPNGATISAPYVVDVLFGDKYSGTNWKLDQPSFVVGTDSNTWAQIDPPGAFITGAAMRGPRLPYYPPQPATQRSDYPTDTPPYKIDRTQSMWWNSIYMNFNNFFFLSHWHSPSTPYDDHTLVLYGLKNFPAVIVDRVMRLPTGIALAGVRNPLLVFPFGNSNYPNILLPRALTGFNLNGSRNLQFDGDVHAKYADTAGSTKFILGTAPFSDFKADGIYSEGAFLTLNLVLGTDDPTFNNKFTIGGLGAVGGSPVDISGSAWTTFSAGRGYAESRLGGLPNNASGIVSNSSITSITLDPWDTTEIIDMTGTPVSVDRNITLTLRNMTRDYKWRFRRSGGGLVQWNLLNPGPAGGTITQLLTGQQVTLALNTSTGNLFVESRESF